MIGLDTNIMLSSIGSEPRVICPVVYAELAASREWEGLKLFLEQAAVDVLWEMPEAVWERAGRAMGEYARMRRGGSLPRRVVADFLIGAHAEHHGLALATFDRVVYETVFRNVRLIF
jgi:predicted nucleic acid-binding protein